VWHTEHVRAHSRLPSCTLPTSTPLTTSVPYVQKVLPWSQHHSPCHSSAKTDAAACSGCEWFESVQQHVPTDLIYYAEHHHQFLCRLTIIESVRYSLNAPTASHDKSTSLPHNTYSQTAAMATHSISAQQQPQRTCGAITRRKPCPHSTKCMDIVVGCRLLPRSAFSCSRSRAPSRAPWRPQRQRAQAARVPHSAACGPLELAGNTRNKASAVHTTIRGGRRQSETHAERCKRKPKQHSMQQKNEHYSNTMQNARSVQRCSSCASQHRAVLNDSRACQASVATTGIACSGKVGLVYEIVRHAA
jgi:hypothetical protein